MTKNVYFNPSRILFGKSVVIESTPRSLKCLAVSMSLMVQESVVCSWLFIVVQTTFYKVFLTFVCSLVFTDVNKNWMKNLDFDVHKVSTIAEDSDCWDEY